MQGRMTWWMAGRGKGSRLAKSYFAAFFLIFLAAEFFGLFLAFLKLKLLLNYLKVSSSFVDRTKARPACERKVVLMVGLVGVH